MVDRFDPNSDNIIQEKNTLMKDSNADLRDLKRHHEAAEDEKYANFKTLIRIAIEFCVEL